VKENPEQQLAIRSVPGIFMILGNGAAYSCVPDAEIQALRRALESSRGVQPHPFITIGERVRITAGPLEGVKGILVRRKNACRVVISVDLLAKSASLEINEWEITPDFDPSRQRLPAVAHYLSVSREGIGNMPLRSL
jgi:transcription antitermination factor NusG